MGNVIRGEFGSTPKDITDPDVILAEHFDLMTERIQSGAVERLFNLQYSKSTFIDAQEKVRNYTMRQLAEVITKAGEIN